MKISKTALLTTICLGGLALMSNYFISHADTPSRSISPTKTWYSIQEVAELQKENPKKVVVDIYTDWCRWCKVMDETTFADPTLMTALQKDFYLVKLNAETTTPIEFKDKTYNFVSSNRRGYHELAAYLLNGGLSYPSFVVLDENLTPIEVIKGYKEGKAFKAALDKVAM